MGYPFRTARGPRAPGDHRWSNWAAVPGRFEVTPDPVPRQRLVLEPRHHMEVRVHDVLTADLPHVPPGVVPVRGERGVQVRFGLEEQVLRGRPLLRREVEHGRAVGFRDDDARTLQGARLTGFDAQEAEVVLPDERAAPEFTRVAVGAGGFTGHAGRIRDALGSAPVRSASGGQGSRVVPARVAGLYTEWMRALLPLVTLLAGTAGAINLSEVDPKVTCYFDAVVVSDRRTSTDPLRLGPSYDNTSVYKAFDAVGIRPFFTGCQYGIFFDVDYTFWPNGQFLMTAVLSLGDLQHGQQGVKQSWSVYRPITTQLQPERLNTVGLALNEVAGAFLLDWHRAHSNP